MSETTEANPAAPGLRRRQAVGLALGAISFAVGIALWWLATAFGVTVLPGPWTVLLRMIELAASGRLFGDMAASLHRVLIGFVLGSVIAIPLGFLMGWRRVARGIIDPWIPFFRVIPPLAIIPLAILTLGIDEGPKNFVIFLTAFLSSVVASYLGVISVDKTYVIAARVLGTKDGVIFARVVIPASASARCGPRSSRPS